MLSRLCEIRSDVQMFLTETDFQLRDGLTDDQRIIIFAYLSGTFNSLSFTYII